MSAYTRYSLSKIYFQPTFCFWLLFTLLATSAFAQQPQVVLGDTNLEDYSDSNPSGTAEAFPVRALATGQVTSLSVYLDSSNSAQTVWVGMYTNANGHPQALLANGLISRPVAGQWNSATLSPVQVKGGTSYWLALLGVNGVVHFRDRNSKCSSETGGQTNLGSLPATWTTGSRWPTCIASMFETGNVTPGSVPSSNVPPSAGISISPHTISLQAGTQQQFAAAVTGLINPVLTWTASGGNINSTGLYIAPSSAGTYTVTAKAGTSRRRWSSTTAMSDSAVVTVTLPSPTPVPTSAQVSVSPTASSIQTGATQQFTALVSGTSNTAVAWSASGGKIDANGLYTAPGTAGTYAITATSSADNSKSAAALVVVSVPQPVAVSISPVNTSVAEGNQFQFTASVSGLSNTAVTWAVTRGSGTITQSGLYTAPRTAESDTITATSQADSTKSVRASIAVIAPHSVSLNWGASSSTDVSFYKVYRGTVMGGPYGLLTSDLKATTYTDSTVQPGGIYYYVTSAVDTAGVESIFSNEFPSVIPSP
jgi:hypothetical protein